MLRAVAFGWRQLSVAENAEIIRELGEDLYHRLATFAEHLQKLGKHLDASVEQFNKATGSLDRQVLSGAGKSTLAHCVEEQLHQRGCLTYVFDGDNVRHGLCGDLGFSLQDRKENLRRISEMCNLTMDAGIMPLLHSSRQ